MARWSRWLPAGVAAALAGGVAVVSQPAAAVDLPDRSAEEVLAMVADHEVEPFSGNFEQTSGLGLPELPADFAGPGKNGDDDATAAPSGPADAPGGATDAPTGPTGAPGGVGEAADLLAMLTGSHTGRVFVGGPETVRLQVMDSYSERNIVRDGEEVWIYDSAENTAAHLALPERRTDGHSAAELPAPAALAEQVLATIDPSTDVSVGQDAMVAGRAAYELVLTPRTTGTLVGSVRLAVDGETGMPLRVTVDAREQAEPGFEVSYTSLDLSEPDADLFDFTPPADARVIEKTIPPHEGRAPEPSGPAEGDRPRPDVVGSGWDTVLVIPADERTNLAEVPMFEELTSAVEGGRLLSTVLVNVLVTDDGRVLLGSVPLERLQTVAGS